ncbi:MAG: DUF2505 family protein [Myxococcales bacterium]|nr:DUF2505 family protein [Myxococcales bacterium]
MRKFTLTHEIACDETTFWKVFFDREYNYALYPGVLGFVDFELQEQTPTSWRLKGTPKPAVPAVLAKAIGDRFGYVETGTFDPDKRVWSFTMKFNSLSEKLHEDGTVRVEAAGERRVKRIVDVTIAAKVFGVGGLLESTTEKETRAGWDKSGAFMDRWVKEHAAG